MATSSLSSADLPAQRVPRAVRGGLRLPVVRGRWRGAALLGGCVVAALGIALALQAGLGVGPYDVLIDGVAARAGITFGLASVAVGAAFVLAGWALGAPVGAGTVVIMATVGPLVDAWRVVLPDPHALGWQVVGFGAALGLIALGLSLMISARLGVGPMEAVMLGLVARGAPLRWARTALEVTVAAAGWALGGVIGLGTVLVALTLGHLIAALAPAEPEVAPPAVSR